VQIIGVVDLRAGQAVRACGGRRDTYQPVAEVAGSAITAGDPVALARAYVEELGVSANYAADLDAILNRGNQQRELSILSSAGVPLWVDAGIRTLAAAQTALAQYASRVVIGLETLRSFTELEAICKAVDRERVAFSLDLKGGIPITNAGAARFAETVQAIARRAVDAGAHTLIVLDLERVGMRRGLDFQILERVRDAVPGAALFAGGGVQGIDDLTTLARCGYEGALVATALQDGRLSPADLATAKGWPHGRDIR
jgi:phosphoribosylformimino-5-aminoimidazole carboxamide ribotide isomerase